ncbi:MAG: pirin family protein [Ferruginibacter sp.]|nr:pirin family protein [Ferruginibacter sp.]
MKKIITRANERGSINHGWLKPAHYFSFGGWQNPEKVHFGALRVLNDDWIAGGGAFATHPHDNMEIVTIPFTGALKHKDSTGGEGVIQAGDVQIMSAGSGVLHSEANESATEAVTLFQIWVFPKEKNIVPRYDQRSFNVNEREGKWQVVVSPLEKDNALWINQDARFSMVNIKAGEKINYENAFAGNGVYLEVIKGTMEVDGIKFDNRDAVGIWETDSFEINILTDVELLAIEVPMHF